MTETRGRAPAALAVQAYLVLLPAGHVLLLPVGGVMSTGADIALLFLLLATVFELVSVPEEADRLRVGLSGGGSLGAAAGGFLRGVALLVLFGVWVALSALWSFHPEYALTKAAGYTALALGAAAIAVSGVDWRRAADAWLIGTALAVVLALGGAMIGPEALRGRVVYEAGGVIGLPFSRLSGPFLHPNMFGDYLVTSALLLWARWPELDALAKKAAMALAVALGISLFLTVSTAWIGGGVALALLGRSQGGLWQRWVGTAVAGAILVAVLVPLDLTAVGLDIASTGIRPQIWLGSLRAVLDSPLLGVGASPYLAEAFDPAMETIGLWDAHNAVLSVLGQFGPLGLGLLAAGLWMTTRGVFGTGSRAGDRATYALRLALIAMAVHSLFLASEDLRHLWAVVGLVGVVGWEFNTPAIGLADNRRA